MVPEGWIEGKVSDVVKALESGVSVNGEDRKRLPGEKGVLKVSAVSYGYFDSSACKVINGDELERAKTCPKAGQIIISRSNTENLVGASAYIEQSCNDLFLPDKLWQTIPRSKSNMKWLSYVLASKKSRYTLSNLATGTSGSMKNITKGELLGLRILIPSPVEQQKIAQILTSWDKAIETVEALIENSIGQKKALMQKLLTGKKRFSEFKGSDWIRYKFGDVLDIYIGGTPSRNKAEYWDVGGVTENHWLSIADLKGKHVSLTSEKITDLGVKNSNVKLIPKNTVVMSFKLSIGRAAITTKPLYTNEAICALIPKKEKELDTEFLYQVLSVVDFDKEIDQAIKGKTLNKAKISRLEVNLPCFEEQKKIANQLRLSDTEISVQEDLLNNLKNQKKSLMQQLLTGKRRVKLDETSSQRTALEKVV